MKPIVIIGSGHAGLTLAREIRVLDGASPVVLISREDICAYYKPNLSKALTMRKSPEDLVMKSETQLQEQLQITLMSRYTVVAVNAGDQIVSVQDDQGMQQDLSYRALVMATGANPVRVPIQTTGPVPIHTLNNLDDFRAYHRDLQGKKRVLVIGAGFVGAEVASDLISQGIQVDVVDKGLWPLQRVLPETLGSAIQNAMAKTGVTWHMGRVVESIEAGESEYRVKLSDGSIILTEMILSAVGLRANTQLANSAGINVGQGYIVDRFSQTSVKGIYALGDCAQYEGSILPFIAPATLAAKALAKTLTGSPAALNFPALPVPVKLSACPTVICPSLVGNGVWEVQGAGTDLEAHLLDEHGQIIGFALTGTSVARKNALMQKCQTTLELVA
ncbi:MAG: FAD-dependent oxidoreductase [Pseudomonadales bacterium]|nr:FAD-dependent oxidoreductase [Pseudomonadales bacterium]